MRSHEAHPPTVDRDGVWCLDHAESPFASCGVSQVPGLNGSQNLLHLTCWPVVKKGCFLVVLKPSVLRGNWTCVPETKSGPYMSEPAWNPAPVSIFRLS